MLVLSRKLHERIVLPTIGAAIEVVAIKPGVVRLGVEAPPDVTILREEVPDRAREWAPAPAPAGNPNAEAELRRLREILRNRLRIAGKGLEQAREGLRVGHLEDVEMIVERLSEDLRLLSRRFEEQPAPPRKPVAAARPRKALLVEDDRNERQLLAGLLRLAGVSVDTAGDGIDALDYLRAQGRPDVLLLDMGLPRCDGLATVRQIRRNPALAGLKIFAVSGSTPDQYDIELGPRGIDRWFQKPVDSEALLRDVTEGLEPATACR